MGTVYKCKKSSFSQHLHVHGSCLVINFRSENLLNLNRKCCPNLADIIPDVNLLLSLGRVNEICNIQVVNQRETQQFGCIPKASQLSSLYNGLQIIWLDHVYFQHLIFHFITPPPYLHGSVCMASYFCILLKTGSAYRLQVNFQPKHRPYLTTFCTNFTCNYWNVIE